MANGSPRTSLWDCSYMNWPVCCHLICCGKGQCPEHNFEVIGSKISGEQLRDHSCKDTWLWKVCCLQEDRSPRIRISLNGEPNFLLLAVVHDDATGRRRRHEKFRSRHRIEAYPQNTEIQVARHIPKPYFEMRNLRLWRNGLYNG